MNADGTNQIRLTNVTAYDVSAKWFPDGSKILFSSSRGGGIQDKMQIYTMNPDGTNQIQLKNNDLYVFKFPSCSADCSKILFAAHPQGGWPTDERAGRFYTVNLDGTNLTPLTSDDANGNQPTWSPDGSKILFYSNKDGNFEIYILDYGLN